MQILRSRMKLSLSKCRAAPLELGEPHMAFFRGCAKSLASLPYANKRQISAVDLTSLTH